MCIAALAPALGTIGAASGIGATLQTIGLIGSVAGPVVQGISEARAARANVAQIQQQRETAQEINATREQRFRRQFAQQLAQQRAELAGRGVDLSSPTAIALGADAAREMSFGAQSIRADGQAQDIEMSSQQRLLRARAGSSILRGVGAGAGSFFTRAPAVWPELLT